MTSKLKADLQALTVGQLRKRAVAEGVPENAIDDARDSQQPKQELISLIMQHCAPDPVRVSAPLPLKHIYYALWHCWH
jgi:hypothetical protein